MYKFDFYDFTAPMISGEMPLLGDIGFEPLSFDIVARAAKIENNAVQALPNGDDYAGDSSTTGLLGIGGEALTVTGNGSNDIDWFRLSNSADGQDIRLNIALDTFTHILQIRLRDELENVVFTTVFFDTNTVVPYIDIPKNLNVEFVDIQFSGEDQLTFSAQLLDDYSGDATTTGEIFVDAGPVTVQGEMVDDVDWLLIRGTEANDTIVLNVDDGSDYVVVRDADGSRVNSFWDGTQSHFVLSGDGPHFVSITHWQAADSNSIEIIKTGNAPVGSENNRKEIILGEEAILATEVPGEDLFWFSVSGYSNRTTVKLTIGNREVFYAFQPTDEAVIQRVILQDDSVGAPLNIDNFSIDLDIFSQQPVSFQAEIVDDDFVDNVYSEARLDVGGAAITANNDFFGDIDWIYFDVERDSEYRVVTEDGPPTNIVIRAFEEFFFTTADNPSYDETTGVFSTADTFFTDYAIAISHGEADSRSVRIEAVVSGTDQAENFFFRDEIVTLDAGAGDDLVNAGLGNTPSVYFSGGDGFDTLYLHVEAYQKFDFRAAEFEVAILREVDGTILGRYSQNGTQDIHTEYDARDNYSWSRKVIIEDTDADALYSRKELVYNDAGVVSREQTLNQDGSFTDIQYDAENAYSFEMRELKYTAEGGDLVSIETLYDSGRQNIVTYDVGNANLFWDLRSQTFDAGDTAAWTSSTSFYANIDGAQIRTRLTIEYDNGLTSDFEYILFGQDAGNTVQTRVDGGDIESWDSWVITKNNSGETIESVRSNDNGVVHSLFYNPDAIEGTATRVVNEDTADIFNWTSIERRLDSDGNTLSLEIDYDEGFTVHTEYDVAGENPWARIVTQIDVDGTEDWDSRSFYYDDNGVIYDTVYI